MPSADERPARVSGPLYDDGVSDQRLTRGTDWWLCSGAQRRISGAAAGSDDRRSAGGSATVASAAAQQPGISTAAAANAAGATLARDASQVGGTNYTLRVMSAAL